MREILFRGKRLDNGEWVEGTTVIRYLHKENTFIGERGDRIAVYKDAETGNIVRIDSAFFAVDPDTVGQYTGLKDKNGKRIFEGDILRHHNGNPDIEEKGVVFWDEKYCGWRRTSNGAFNHGLVGTYRLSPDCVYEIIGNIHDNPELLEVHHE